MAVGADIDTQFLAFGGTGLEGRAAGASDRASLIVGMDSLLHNIFHLFRLFLPTYKNSRNTFIFPLK